MTKQDKSEQFFTAIGEVNSKLDLIHASTKTLENAVASLLADQKLMRAFPGTQKAYGEDEGRKTDKHRTQVPLDLDSEQGNFVVFKDPPLWVRDGGESFAGKRLSECPPEYLDAVSSYEQWRADQARKDNKLSAKGNPIWELRQKDAARASAWAARKRQAQE